MKIGSVLIFRGVDRLFDYVLTKDIEVGTHLNLPFGRFTVEGVLIEKKDVAEGDDLKLKPIQEVNLKKPVLPDKTIALLMWFSHYYQTTPYKAYQTIVGRRKVMDISEYKNKNDVVYSPDFVHSADQQVAIKTILSLICKFP